MPIAPQGSPSTMRARGAEVASPADGNRPAPWLCAARARPRAPWHGAPAHPFGACAARTGARCHLDHPSCLHCQHEHPASPLSRGRACRALRFREPCSCVLALTRKTARRRTIRPGVARSLRAARIRPRRRSARSGIGLATRQVGPKIHSTLETVEAERLQVLPAHTHECADTARDLDILGRAEPRLERTHENADARKVLQKHATLRGDFVPPTERTREVPELSQSG